MNISVTISVLRMIHGMSTGGSFRSGVTRPQDVDKFSTGAGRHPFSSKGDHGSKHGPLQSFTKTPKSGTKPGTKSTKTASAKPADEQLVVQGLT